MAVEKEDPTPKRQTLQENETQTHVYQFTPQTELPISSAPSPTLTGSLFGTEVCKDKRGRDRKTPVTGECVTDVTEVTVYKGGDNLADTDVEVSRQQ